MIADTAMEVHALRQMVYQGAWLYDQGKKISRESAIVKAFGTEVTARAVDRALQVHGAFGTVRGVPIERHWRDERIARIFEGTNEIQRLIIAQDAFRSVGFRA
jgi:alkylation response protein AidB-like acyl-CoA dehydrogenase